METRKVVINDEYGGFSLSHAAFLKLREMGSEHAKKEPDYGERWPDGSGPREPLPFSIQGNPGHFLRDIPRDDPMLVKVVEEMGEVAHGICAHLKVVQIPADVKWEISEYDGLEHVTEVHRTWR